MPIRRIVQYLYEDLLKQGHNVILDDSFLYEYLVVDDRAYTLVVTTQSDRMVFRVQVLELSALDNDTTVELMNYAMTLNDTLAYPLRLGYDSSLPALTVLSQVVINVEDVMLTVNQCLEVRDKVIHLLKQLPVLLADFAG